ncbi:MAG: radical SAM protein [Bacteroidetes bacterium]|nr:radical SAM protein [Bacteroidota bacterium]
MSSWKGKTRGGVLGYKIFVWTLQNFGLSFAYFLLYFVVTYFIFASPKAFGWIYRYFRRSVGFGFFRSLAGVYRNYHIFGQILVDKGAMLSGVKTKFTFDFEGEEYLRQMDKGGLLISGHIGNWEIAGQLLNRLEKKVNIILFDAEHEQIKKYLSDVYTNRSVNFIVIKEDYSHLKEIHEALDRGEIVAMHGDRFIEGNKVLTINFLGKPALFPTGPVNLAARFGVPVSYVFAVKETRKHYHFYATPLRQVVFSTNLKKREVILREAVEAYVSAFERIVKKYPLQWFNYYDFWNIPETKHKPPETKSPVNKKKLLLVSANKFAVPYPVYPIGLSYLQSYLSERMPQFDIRIFDFNFHTLESFREYLLDYKPDYTGISLRNIDDVDSISKTWFIHGYREVVEMVKKTVNTRIIIGGSAFSIFPVELFEFFEPEFGIHGEGEESLYQLLQCLENKTDPGSIQGLVYRNNQGIQVNPRTEFIRQLDLSFDPELLDFYWGKSGMLNIQSKRGCPHKCIYCTYPLIEGRNVRTLNSDKIIETLSELYFNKGIDYVFFTDSVFNISNQFNIELAQKMIKHKLKIKWGAYFSPHGLDRETLSLFADAGLTHIEFGTESLSDTTLKNYGKHFTVDEVVEVSDLCNDLNIYFSHFLILGGYGETEETINEGFENSKRFANTVFFPYIGMRIYPGTKLYEYAVKEGVVPAGDKLLKPAYYLAPGINYDTLKERAEKTGRRFVFPDEDVVTAMNKMRARQRKGMLWHHLKK